MRQDERLSLRETVLDLTQRPQNIDTSDLDATILDRKGLSAALNERQKRLGR